jgi:hypothetical protein
MRETNPGSERLERTGRQRFDRFVIDINRTRNRTECPMQLLIEEEAYDATPVRAVVREQEINREDRDPRCEPLWLTFHEAETLLVLCAASPVSAGPGEHDLFMKLGDFFRSSRLSG